MKVKCINNENDGYCLTINKIYDVIHIYYDGDYDIINDNSFEWNYPKEFFRPLSEIRNEKIDKLLGE